MCHCFRLWLKRVGATVVCACESGEIDLDRTYDLIIADWGSTRDDDLPMPAPVIYVTGQTKDDVVNDRPNLRPVFYKPFPMRDLIDKAVEMLKDS